MLFVLLLQFSHEIKGCQQIRTVQFSFKKLTQKNTHLQSALNRCFKDPFL